MWISSGRQVTLSFDPTTDDRRTVMSAVARAFEQGPHGAGEQLGVDSLHQRESPEQTVDGWAARAMRDYVAALKPAARRVLFAVVTSSPCPIDDARATAQLSERRFEEARDSLQEALRVVPQVDRLPFDVVDGCFIADDEVAELAARALDRIYDA